MINVLLLEKPTINSKMTDGCPDKIANDKFAADTDGDGILDNLDLCPTQSETFNGYQDTDGCPDKSIPSNDRDLDGISDILDSCPLNPETFNKFQDD